MTGVQTCALPILDISVLCSYRINEWKVKRLKKRMGKVLVEALLELQRHGENKEIADNIRALLEVGEKL